MANNGKYGGESASNLSISSFNVNSIGKNPKRQQIFNFLKSKKSDIIVLVDTRIDKELENIVKQEWGSMSYFSSFSSQSRGVAILFKKYSCVEVLKEKKDPSGNILSLLLKFDSKKILLSAIYGPNEDNPHFYRDKVFYLIEDWEPDFAVYAGDWNLVLNQNLDTKNYLHENNLRARAEVKNKMEYFSLIDVWRELNPSAKKYTWKGKITRPFKFSRLDFFLISNSLFHFIKKSSIEPGLFSDHSIPSIEIDFRNFERGRGYWKFNNSLLKDPDYVAIVKKSIKNVLKTYASNDFTEEIIDNASPEQLQDIPTVINDQLLFDMLQLEIRGNTIKYASAKKKESSSLMRTLLHRLEELEALSGNNTTEANILLESTRAELESIFKMEAEGAAVRARAKYKMEGEKASKLFCNLEKYNGTQKFIPQLIKHVNGNNITLSKQNEVEGEIKYFYQKLYSNQDHNISETIESFLGQSCNSLPRVTEAQANTMGGHITIQEMTNYLKKTKNNVSPGVSGFTGDFYKFFWRDLKNFIVRSVNYSFDIGSLSIQQRLGIITLLPKGTKDRRFLANWRPLTLLNSIYKLLSGCITERIKPVLDKIIHPDQKGFVSGRYIGEVVRTCYDTLDFAKNNNKSGLLLLIDFEKAFDSISFKFIEKCLVFFNFPPDLVKWVNLLLNNFQASINHCGNLSGRFNIGRGCRQGDPIAPYLFILALELLAHKIRMDTRVKGFCYGNLTHVLDLYADDLTIYLTPSEQNLQTVLDIIRDFFHLSCLKISVSKTKAIWFGKDCDSNIKLCKEENLVWTTKFTLLGLEFDNKLEDMERNYSEKINEIEKMLQGWLYRHLTPYGKIVIIKSLALSKLTHIALVVPDLKKKDLNKLEQIFLSFLWSKKVPKVSKIDILKPQKFGGLDMVDIFSFWQSLKCTWLRRMLTTSAFWPEILKLELLKYGFNLENMLYSGPSYLQNVAKQIRNNFWKNCFDSITKLSRESIFSNPERFYLFSIFQNPLFKSARRALPRSNFGNPDHKIQLVSDFFKSEGSLYSLEELNSLNNTTMTENQLKNIQQAIQLGLASLNLNLGQCDWHPAPKQPNIVAIANLNIKGCRAFYRIFRARANFKENTSKIESKWHAQLNITLSVNFWNNAWRLHSSMQYNNQLKWLQYQILRKCLFTNNRVSKFKHWVSDRCDFCGLHVENPLTLFTQCPIVLQYWADIRKYLEYLGHDLPTGRLQLLFGIHTESFDSVKNIAIMVGKKTIWMCKIVKSPLSLEKFKYYLKDYLNILCFCHSIKHTSSVFDDQWGSCFWLLQGNHGPQLPPRDGEGDGQLVQGQPLLHL